MKVMKIVALMFLVSLFILLASCGKHDDYEFDGVNWDGNSGTLEIVNGSNKDMIIFVGQIPAQSSMLGGVKAGATRKLDISGHVDDFDVGGYAIIRGVSKEEWDEDFDPSNAKIEFSAMVTYRRGAEYRYNIDASYMGDYGFRVTNSGKVGIELRKDSPNGEKIAYIPALQQNQVVYTQTSNAITLFPVYVFFNDLTKEVTSLEATSMFATATIAPRPLAENNIPNIYFPTDGLTWQDIVNSLKPPVAYLYVKNNIMNESGYITNALSYRLNSQNGYDAINPGETAVFEVESTEAGSQVSLIAVFRGGITKIPIHFKDDLEIPVIKNGYDYDVSITYTPGDGGAENMDNYSAIISERGKRDLSDKITSL